MLSKSSSCSGKLVLTGFLKKGISTILIQNLKSKNWDFDTNLLKNNIVKASFENIYISSSLGSKIVSIHKLENKEAPSYK
jgi:hypothetical protein